MLSCSYLDSFLNSNNKFISTTSHGVVGYASGVMFGLIIYDIYSHNYGKKLPPSAENPPLFFNVAMINLYSITGLCSGLLIGYNKKEQ